MLYISRQTIQTHYKNIHHNKLEVTKNRLVVSNLSYVYHQFELLEIWMICKSTSTITTCQKEATTYLWNQWNMITKYLWIPLGVIWVCLKCIIFTLPQEIYDLMLEYTNPMSISFLVVVTERWYLARIRI